MGLKARDGLATLLVACAVVFYAVWETEVGLTGMSTRMMGILVFVLGYAACTSDQAGVAGVYGAHGQREAGTAYAVLASTVGGVALLSGLIAMVAGSHEALVILVSATVALWAMATARHALAGRLAHAQTA